MARRDWRCSRSHLAAAVAPVIHVCLALLAHDLGGRLVGAGRLTASCRGDRVCPSRPYPGLIKVEIIAPARP